MMLLPESSDAKPGAPRYAEIARTPNLAWWLAAVAALAAGVVAAVVPLHLMPAWLAVCGIGVWLAFIDWRAMLLPRHIVYVLTVVTSVLVALEAWLASDAAIFVRAMGAAAVAFGTFYLFWMIAENWRPGSFGFGDVRLSVPLAMALGSVSVTAVFIGLYGAFVLGALAGLVRDRQHHDEGFAFGPWMVMGAVLGPVVSAILS
jgi:leader peptidase (prepilin peptidase)/N-methyltransferase